MTCKICDLSVLAYANGFTLWHYKSNDTINEVTSLNYFIDISDMLTRKDILMINASDGSCQRVVGRCDQDFVVVSPLS